MSSSERRAPPGGRSARRRAREAAESRVLAIVGQTIERELRVPIPAPTTERERPPMLDRFTWYRQSAYLWKGDGINVYIDPWGVTGDPPADVVFITHAHFDHYNPDDLPKVRRGGTKIVAPQDVALELSGDVTSVAPGDSFEVEGIT